MSVPGPAVASTADNSKGTISLVTGILSLFCCGVVFGIVAIVTGLMGRSAAKAGTANNGGTATVGIVLGVIGLIAGSGLQFWAFNNNFN